MRGSAVTVVLLSALALAACDDGGTDDVVGGKSVDTSARLDAAQQHADEAVADLVPALESRLGVQTRDWRGDFRTCSDPSTHLVAYHVTVQLDPVPGGAARGLLEVAATLDELGWASDAPGRTTLNANLEGTGIRILIGAGATDLRLATDCFDVGSKVGAAYVERDAVDFTRPGG